MKLFSPKRNDRLPRKFDGVIEAIRTTPGGMLVSARIYERRGPTWSDRVIIPRIELVRRLQAGQKIVIGKRIANLGSTFDLKSQVRLVCANGDEILVSGDCQAVRDWIEAPLY